MSYVGVQVGRVDVAERDDLGVGMGEEPLEELAAPVADADEAEADLIIGPEHLGGASAKAALAAVAALEKSRRFRCVDTMDPSIPEEGRCDHNPLIRYRRRANVNVPAGSGNTLRPGTMRMMMVTERMRS